MDPRRTQKERAADELDSEVFRLIQKIDRFAMRFNDSQAEEMATIIDGLRHRVRRSMHPDDQKAAPL